MIISDLLKSNINVEVKCGAHKLIFDDGKFEVWSRFYRAKSAKLQIRTVSEAEAVEVFKHLTTDY